MAITPTTEITPTATAAVTYTTLDGQPFRPGRLWPTPDPAQAQDHYWLDRPIGPGGEIYASAYYPYGSNGQGEYIPHFGADIVNPFGTPVLAMAEAEVAAAGSDLSQIVGEKPNFYGNYILLRLLRSYREQPLFVLYGHLSRIDVQAGELVQPGQPIGQVGMAGVALGPHLHIEVRVGTPDYAHTRNPELWLKPSPGLGTIAGRLLNASGQSLPGVPVLIYQLPQLTRIWQEVHTYLDLPGINPDDDWGENFMLADVPVGSYRLETAINGEVYRQEITVQEGRTSFAAIQTN
jgi:murein DD-endopeptidase MepM/ murein hydrolase activator NlpD